MPGSQNAEFGSGQTPLANPGRGNDNPRGYRDKVTGRFARRPIEDIDAESRFDPMSDFVENIGNVSGAPSASTIEHPRYAPESDTLAGTGPSHGASPLRARNPVLVPVEAADHTVYGLQGAILRAAARDSGPDDPTAYLVGLASHGMPVNVVVNDDR